MATFPIASGDAAGGRIFGREHELSLLNELVDRLPEHGAALLVRGEAGIGKSTLLAAASRRAEAAGMRVLRTTGVQSEAQLPFAGLHQLVLPVLDRADQLPAPQRTALLAAFGMAEASALNRFLIGLAMLELLSDAAERSPLLVVADDAQWLDRSTAGVLGFVARRVEHEPIGVLVASREDGGSSLDEAGLPELRLGGLGEAAAGALLSGRGRRLAPAVRGRLLEQADGNPLALAELPILLSEDELGGDSPLPAPLPLTERLERTFAAQVATLPESTRTLLLIAATDEGGGVLGEILAAARVIAGDEPAVEGFAPAVEARLVDVEGTRVVFRHPLVRSAVYQAANLVGRRTAHAALAGALVGQPDRQVWHRAAALAGPDESIAAALDATAVQAQRRGAIGVAINAFERAVELSEDQQRQGRRLLDTAELAFQLGHRDVVSRLMREAQRLELSPLERARIAWVRENYSEEGNWSGADRIRSFVELANQMRRDGDADRALKSLLTVALRCWWSNPDQETRDLVVAAAEQIPVSERNPELIAILALAAPVERGALVIERLSSLAPDETGDPERMLLLGGAASAVGAFDQAAAALATSVAALREQGRLGLLAQGLLHQANTAINLGNPNAARSAAEEAGRLARETAQPLWWAAARLVEARAVATRGDEASAEALAAEAERTLLPIAANPMLSLAALARGVAASGDGRYSEAYEHLRRVFDPTDLAYHPFVRSWIVGDLVEAAVHSGHRDEARTAVEELEPLAVKTRSPILRVGLCYARSLLAEDDEAETLFVTALGADLAEWPFVHARMQLAYGTWLRRQRRVIESRPPLGAAHRAFEALGATPWAERARQELRAAGVVSPERERAALHELTPQELQIARMAASGLSNREIGRQLYLSHRTVGAHLYRTFPKLGIISRGQLRDALDTALP